jgi:hypothetical protein
MGKRNKIRYKSAPVRRIPIVLTGQVWLKYRDDEAMEQAQKGDLMLHPYNDVLRGPKQGDYESTGYVGYFKLDVHDGKEWRAVIVTGIFEQREQHFSKSERPIDTYGLCAELLAGLKGRVLLRTYREHYILEED